MNSKTTAAEVLKELERAGKDSYKRTLMVNHGVREPVFGVAISELKKIQKRIGKDYELALELYASGNYDAMYLAGLIADDERMTRKDLQAWADGAYAGALPGTTVASVAAGSPHGLEMALKWIESKKELVACAGWATLSFLVAMKSSAAASRHRPMELGISEIKKLIERVQKTIHAAPDLVRYHMNAFLISAGSYVAPLTDYAIEVGEKIGEVTADLGNNSCAIPFAPDYIRKVQARGAIGKKRKCAKC
jgi:3-methyladenine DNA glycosylase AlkD